MEKPGMQENLKNLLPFFWMFCIIHRTCFWTGSQKISEERDGMAEEIMTPIPEEESRNFIHQFIDEDIAEGGRRSEEHTSELQSP